MRHTPRTLAAALACLALWLAGCDQLAPQPGIGGAVTFERLPGWTSDRHAEAWPVLLATCDRLVGRPEHAEWNAPCHAARAMDVPDDAAARAFFEKYFEPHVLRGRWWRREALFTGYYEPLLEGSRTRTDRYRYPLYSPPPDLVRVELGDLYPELKDRVVRGQLLGKSVRPYPDRARIETSGVLSGHELLWVDDPVELFFLHVQGSGRVRLPDGEVIGVSYADQNGRPYTSIGRVLADSGAIPRDDVNLFTIREWLRAHPERASQVMHENPSFVFFRERQVTSPGPQGSLGVALTPGRSLAIDPRVVPLGLPMWVDTVLPDTGATVMRRLMFALDTGGAIKGPLRADLFFGAGPGAEDLAGRMKQPGQLFVLLPRTTPGTAP